MNPIIQYWKKFQSEFKNALDEQSFEDLSYAWLSQTNRTSFYENNLIPKIATSMNLEFINEDFKIDYTLCQRVEDYLAPLIFIESENNAQTATHELRKLNCLNAPLKVLVVCSEWCDEQGFWKHGGGRKNLTETWLKNIKSHGNVWPSNSITAIIVAEWKDNLRYYSFACNSNGEIVDEHKILFEK